MKRLRWPLIALFSCILIIEWDSKSFSILGYYLLSNIDSVTQGEIVKSELVSTYSRAPRAYGVVYRYVVDNVEYKFNLVNFHQKMENARGIISKYPVGKHVDVYYDSRHPQYAVLEKTGLGFGIYWRMVLTIALVALCWYLDM